MQLAEADRRAALRDPCPGLTGGNGPPAGVAMPSARRIWRSRISGAGRRRVVRSGPDGLAPASGSRVPSMAAWATSVRRRLLVAGVGPQPGEGLGQVDAGAFGDHALGLLDHHAAGQGAGELLVQALGLGAGTMLHDAEGGEVGEGAGDDDVRLVHRGAGGAEQVQGAEGHLPQPQRQGGRRPEAGLRGRRRRTTASGRTRPAGSRARRARRCGRRPGTGLPGPAARTAPAGASPRWRRPPAPGCPPGEASITPAAETPSRSTHRSASPVSRSTTS